MDDYLKLLGAGAVTLGAVTTATAMYYLNRPKPIEQPVDIHHQSLEVPGKDRARVSCLCKNGKLVEYLEEDVRTLREAFQRGSRVSKNGPCLGWKPTPSTPYQWMSYSEALSRAGDLGCGLIKKGQQPVNSTHIGIYSQNRPEYVITEQGCYMFSMVLVPLYDTLGREACKFILNQAEISIVICDNNTKVQNLLNDKTALPLLHTLVVMEEPSQENLVKAMELKVTIMTFKQLEELGSQNPHEPVPAKPDDNCMVCYTSGTTGLPKGAMLTHAGLISIVVGCYLQVPFMNIGPDDIMISYLPLAHSYERLIEVYVYMFGGRIGFFQGDVRKLMDDIKELKPTLFPTVPRLLNRVYDKVMAQVNSSPIKKYIFNLALRKKEEELQRGIVRNDGFWDKLAFRKVAESLGGRIRLISTGSAPLSPSVLTFIRCVTGCVVLEGYGQTECHAIATLQVPGDHVAGNVGPPLTCNYIKLADVPDMNYFAADQKGEICIKGPNVFKGYLKDPKKTREALDDDGWLHTGDIGTWLPNGTLKIIDRKKHIFKLAQGEYIAPEKIENIYIRSQLVCQMYVHGDSLKACLIGVAVPDADTFPKFAKKSLGIMGTLESLAANPACKKAILEDITEVGKKAGLQSFEQVKDIYIYPEQFSVANGLLTPTLKSKRLELKKFFNTQIEDMYSRLT
ncbi:long-chain-fatty-acid--CoA ligase 5-like [Liolophura sinensis]|uniref:long-chain-fatty-acid--CoA ligase 5-like n=1 Tax=Liolophura sinensis TaxID=3198878 RepID=UPI0031586391